MGLLSLYNQLILLTKPLKNAYYTLYYMTANRKKQYETMLNVRLDDSSRAALRAAAAKYSVEGVHMSESEFARRAIDNEIARTMQRNGIKVKEKKEETLAQEVNQQLEKMNLVLRQIDTQTRKTESWSVLIAREMGVQL